MIAFLITLLIFCCIAAVLLYVARLLISAFPIPQPFANIIYAIVILILLSLFLSEMGWVGHVHGWRSW